MEKNDIRVNWFNVTLAVLLAAISAFLMNYRDWHPGVFTGWSLFGFGVLAFGALVFGGLMVLVIRDDAMWAVPVAFVIGLCLGVGGVFFFQNTDVGWKETIAGLVAFAVIGALISGIGVTRWERP